MEREKILEAKKLAQEFLRTVNEMEKVEENIKNKKASLLYCIAFPGQKANVHKASLDLTNALAIMRMS